MLVWQINDKKNIQQTVRTEIVNDIEYSKIKITKVLLDEYAYKSYLGETKSTYPLIPCSFSVGIISEFGNDDAYEFQKGSRVYLSALVNCDECYECVTDNEDKCSDMRFSGRNREGVLKEFAITPNKQIFALPPTVSDKDALLLDLIALCISTIENVDIKGGEHVLIIGNGIQSIILSQLVSYYKGIPVLISNDDSIKTFTESAGIYYSMPADDNTEKQLREITGGRMAQKVIYACGTELSTKYISRLASPNATVVFSGFDSYNITLNLTEVMNKQLCLYFVKNGYGNVESAINLLATKKIDTSFYSFKQIKFNDVGKYFAECDKVGFAPCYVNLMEL